jgi:excinuclease UvrABC nuclease subunit
LKERLLEHIENNEWPDVKYFQYMECENEIDMNRKEDYAIKSFQPKYNRMGKSELVKRFFEYNSYRELKKFV